MLHATPKRQRRAHSSSTKQTECETNYTTLTIISKRHFPWRHHRRLVPSLRRLTAQWRTSSVDRITFVSVSLRQLATSSIWFLYDVINDNTLAPLRSVRTDVAMTSRIQSPLSSVRRQYRSDVVAPNDVIWFSATVQSARRALLYASRLESSYTHLRFRNHTHRSPSPDRVS